MRAPRWAAPALVPVLPVLLALLVLAGCARPALRRQEYRSRATRVCAEAQTAQRAIPAATDRATLLAGLRRLRAINRRMTNGIAALNPPIGTDKSHDAAVEIGLRTDRTLGALTLALRRSPSPAAELARRRPALARAAAVDAHRWARLRLHGCAGGPSQAMAGLRAPR